LSLTPRPSDEEYASTFNPNVFAAQRTIRGALPAFRARGRGTFVNVGSAAGFWGNPSRCAYSATKHALAGLSDALARELAPFGLRVLLVEPGAFRTGFAGAALAPAAATHGNGNVSAEYVGSEADKVVAYTRTLSAEAPGDPAKAARVVLDAVDGTGWAAGAQPFVRLPLGRDAVELMKRKIALLQAELEIVQAAAAATDFDVV
jgi:NAD(P)-dependent dehydrogenase (short-subunit alcohol dehydrogenase family)